MNFDLQKSAPRDIYNLVMGLVAPRPIALVTTLNPDGSVNAAPFSSYNYLCTDPPIVGLGIHDKDTGSGGLKDTARNIERSGEFVVNVVTEDLAARMNVCGVDFPPEVSELDMAGLAAEPSALVSVPRIREAHAALECRLYQTLKPGPSRIVLGNVLAIYVEDRFIDPKGPYIRAQDLHALGRMNGSGNYVRTKDAFMTIPRISYKSWLEGERGKPDPLV
jgi:flavin reductase (DIM6/NTAB) family NADH-FMN oxidoreductase RutF